MKIVSYIFFILVSIKFYAQEDFKDTIWFNQTWNECPKTAAHFYRVYKKAINGFLVYDKFLNGTNQMIAEASEVKPRVIEEGYSVYYNEKGFKEKRGYSKNDERVGIWISYFENEKDSSVYEYLDNQPVKYHKKSPLQKEEIYTIVEKQAEYPGGIAELVKFIQTNLVYPKKCREISIGGKVILKFVIEENGSVENIAIVKSSCVEEMDSEAERIVKLMPKWKPAEMNGRAVKCYFNLPINFKMEDYMYLFDSENKNELFLRIKNDILTGNQANLYPLLKDDITSINDYDVIYNYAVYCALNKKKREACENFARIEASSLDNSKLIKKQTKELLVKKCN